MSRNTQKLFFYASSEKEDEFDEDIDNYDNERFNVYDDGIDLVGNEVLDEMDEDDDDLIEDDNSLPLFNEEEMDEIEAYDDMEE
ncbi:MAG: hypothetical protein PQJ60_15055 [Spirochaetales bacterium]|nr:hypothetical protein [Spirochaetales bacterium]